MTLLLIMLTLFMTNLHLILVGCFPPVPNNIFMFLEYDKATLLDFTIHIIIMTV